jgi:DNA-binding NtrC family response regulator
LRILVVDDDPIGIQLIAAELADEGHDCELAGDGREALERLEASGEFDLILSDLVMPHLDGLGLLRVVKERSATIPVILMTGAKKTADMAITAEDLGADDYLLKPLKPGEVTFAVDRAERHQALQKRLEALDEAVQDRYGFGNLIGKNPQMLRIYEAIEVVAQTDATVLVTGETGTGKELVARAIHFNSDRREERFVTINCGALPETLLESELFGHERGAFTGAAGMKTGKFEYGNGGTVFLDEVGEIPLPIQVKILRVLQERELERVGGNETIRVDVRMIAATNVDLPRAIAEGRFREDLYYRLNVVPLAIPPLRERKEDVPLLVRHFLARYRERSGRSVTRVSPGVMKGLMLYDWPGNVRELENALERACIMERGSVIRSIDLPGQRAPEPAATVEDAESSEGGLNDAVASFEKRFVAEALRRHRGHIGRTATSLGVTERTLHRKMTRYKLNKIEFK